MQSDLQRLVIQINVVSSLHSASTITTFHRRRKQKESFRFCGELLCRNCVDNLTGSGRICEITGNVNGGLFVEMR